jgi:hypothetical protein
MMRPRCDPNSIAESAVVTGGMYLAKRFMGISSFGFLVAIIKKRSQRALVEALVRYEFLEGTENGVPLKSFQPLSQLGPSSWKL